MSIGNVIVVVVGVVAVAASWCGSSRGATTRSGRHPVPSRPVPAPRSTTATSTTGRPVRAPRPTVSPGRGEPAPGPSAESLPGATSDAGRPVLGSDDAVLVVGGGAGGHACVDRLPGGRRRPAGRARLGRRPPAVLPALRQQGAPRRVGRRDRAGPRATGLVPDQRRRGGPRVRRPGARSRRAAGLVDRRADPLGRCVLATGSDPAPLPVAAHRRARGDDPLGSDAERLVAALDGPVVVVGSGFVGCEAAASLRARGVDVTMVSEEPRPQADRLGDDVGRLVEGWLRDGGTTLARRAPGGGDRSPRRRAGRRRRRRRRRWRRRSSCVAVGARPRTALAADLGLGDDDGVPVDTTMVTAAPDVLAVGDIAAAWHAIGRRRLRGRALGRRRRPRPGGRPDARRGAGVVDDPAGVLVDDRRAHAQARGVGRRLRRGPGRPRRRTG